MSPAKSVHEIVTPETWDSNLILNFLETPAFEDFSGWIDSELAALEAKWGHTSSPDALKRGGVTRPRRRVKPR